MDSKHKNALDVDRILELYEQGYDYYYIMEEVGAKSPQAIETLLKRKKLFVSRKGLDVNKVKALAKAGWDLEKIYGEFSGKYKREEIERAMHD